MDKDLESIQQVNDLVEKARQAQKILAAYSQQEIDRLTALMAEYGYRASRDLAELACRETSFVGSKVKPRKIFFPPVMFIVTSRYEDLRRYRCRQG